MRRPVTIVGLDRRRSDRRADRRSPLEQARAYAATRRECLEEVELRLQAAVHLDWDEELLDGFRADVTAATFELERALRTVDLHAKMAELRGRA